MSADILGTSCDQCRSMVQYSFTSTETKRLVRTDNPGRPPRLSHSSWTMIHLYQRVFILYWILWVGVQWRYWNRGVMRSVLQLFIGLCASWMFVAPKQAVMPNQCGILLSLSVCLSVSLSVCLFVCLSVCLCVSVSRFSCKFSSIPSRTRAESVYSITHINKIYSFIHPPPPPTPISLRLSQNSGKMNGTAIP